MDVEVNYLAVFLAGLSTMVVGAIWYNPKIFGTLWMRLAKVKPDNDLSGSEMFKTYGSVLLASFGTAYVLAHVTYLSFNFFQNGFLQDALSTAFWLWLGFTALRFFTHDTFEKRPLQLTILGIAYELVTVLVMATIIGLLGIS